MRRTILLALFAALVLTSPAVAADPVKVLRDCNDDGTLQGNYSASELRDARNELPTDIDEYSDCRDVLSRALAAKTSSSNDSGGGDTGGAGGGSGDSGTGGPDTGSGTTPSPEPATGPDSGTELPTTPQEKQAITQAAASGDRAVTINGRPVSPGSSRLAADVGRNGLPGTLIAVLALLGAAALSALVPFVRRRVVAHRKT